MSVAQLWAMTRLKRPDRCANAACEKLRQQVVCVYKGSFWTNRLSNLSGELLTADECWESSCLPPSAACCVRCFGRRVLASSGLASDSSTGCRAGRCADGQPHLSAGHVDKQPLHGGAGGGRRVKQRRPRVCWRSCGRACDCKSRQRRRPLTRGLAVSAAGRLRRRCGFALALRRLQPRRRLRHTVKHPLLLHRIWPPLPGLGNEATKRSLLPVGRAVVGWR